MNHRDYQTLLNDALAEWGYDAQRSVWIEEMAELIQVLAKQDRKVNPSFKEEIEDEIADVDICLDQMKQLFPSYAVFRERKIERLKRLVYGVIP